MVRIRALPSGTVGKRDAGRHHACLKQRAREIHGHASIADDDGRNRRLARRSGHAANVEPGPPKLCLEVARVLPQPLDAFRLLLQNVERRNAGGRD